LIKVKLKNLVALLPSNNGVPYQDSPVGNSAYLTIRCGDGKWLDALLPCANGCQGRSPQLDLLETPL